MSCPVMGDFSIQISSNLVNSLAGGEEEKSKKKTKGMRTKLPREPQAQQSQAKTNQKQVSDDLAKHEGPSSMGWPLQPPVFLPVTPPSQSASAELEAIRAVLQESERVMEKLQRQEENVVQEATQRAKELREREFKLPYQKPLACVAENEACLACYKEHLKDPLKCADLVRNFADCARRVRQQVRSARMESISQTHLMNLQRPKPRFDANLSSRLKGSCTLLSVFLHFFFRPFFW